ncbi:MAG: hypothetical protein IPM64_07610 [Phycisphaerales bacterium]|nr:hypothetical protein [Phycisphaerales bacterium]
MTCCPARKSVLLQQQSRRMAPGRLDYRPLQIPDARTWKPSGDAFLDIGPMYIVNFSPSRRSAKVCTRSNRTELAAAMISVNRDRKRQGLPYGNPS